MYRAVRRGKPASKEQHVKYDYENCKWEWSFGLLISAYALSLLMVSLLNDQIILVKVRKLITGEYYQANVLGLWINYLWLMFGEVPSLSSLYLMFCPDLILYRRHAFQFSFPIFLSLSLSFLILSIGGQGRLSGPIKSPQEPWVMGSDTNDHLWVVVDAEGIVLSLFPVRKFASLTLYVCTVWRKI